MKTYHGICASPGVAVGTVRKVEHRISRMSRIIESPEQERAMLEGAVEKAKRELERLADRSAPSERDIFTFQSCLLEDDGMFEQIYACIAEGMGAAAAVDKVGTIYADRLRAMADNEYIQLRSADVLDACRRVVEILDGSPRRSTLEYSHPAILAADTLLPSDIVSAPAGMILGIITSSGSTLSHAAILARSLSLPVLVQVGEEFLRNCDGYTVAMDADAGLCILDPDADVSQCVVARLWEGQRSDESMDSLRAAPNCTRDGEAFHLLANCVGPSDIATAIEAGAEGVGILRSELFLLRGRMPEEQAQYRFYMSCLEAARGRRVCVRTFDFGAEKTTAVFSGEEINPALGLRGIRYSLRNPHELEAQFCALLRAAAHGPLLVTLPMVSCIEDWDAARSVLVHCKQVLARRGEQFDPDMPLGMIVEVPAACLMAEDFIRHGCKFFCIGTNDLVQYTHAADRTLSALEPYYRTNSRAVRRLIGMAVVAARNAGIPVSVCGLAVGSAEHALEYFRLGVRSFSMSAQNLMKVKKALTEYSASDSDADAEMQTATV